MKIHVHLGVHKTATTFIQSTLAKNLAALNAEGIGYAPLRKFRPLLLPLLISEREAFRLDDHLAKFFQGAAPDLIEGLIFSDENLIGWCGEFVARGKLYPAAQKRLAILRERLSGHEITVYLAIRSYDTFAASAYCEAIRNTGRFVSFDAFERRLDYRSFGWPRLLSRFQEALGPAQLKIWRHEDFRGNEDIVLRALAFGTDQQFEWDISSRAERASFSDVAVRALEAVAAAVGPNVANQLILPITEQLPKDESRKAFDPWDAERKQMLQERYEADCAAIPADMWLVRPNIRSSASVTPGFPAMANEGVGGCETEAVGEQSGTPHRLAFPRAEKTAVTDAARPDATMGGNRHIWLVGDGRSGTTWACSLLNHKRVFCEYFEPLHVRKNANLGRTIIPYVRPGHVPDRLLSLYRALTQRTYASKWSGPKYAQNEPVIIKDIYALLACAAIVKAVPDIQPVLIARHPYEVAVSKMQLNNWAWYREPENLFAQRELVSDWLSPYEETIRSANTQFERYVVLWCLMYRVFMRQLDPDAYPVLRYNELNSGNLAGIADVFDTLAGGRTRYTDEALLSETFAKKTWTAKAGSRGGERPPRPSGGELERCQRFIEKFELNDFVASLGEPNMHDANSG